MHNDSILFSIFLIFSGAAVLATIALYLRQAMLLAYLALGIIIGPWGLALVNDAKLIQDIAEIGIIFLLFLLGLNLSPYKLFELLKQTTHITLISTLVFALTAGIIAHLFGFALIDSLIIGISASFSSTIIGLKLLPTTVLHHKRTGEVIISILLLQDIIAIIALLCIQSSASSHDTSYQFLLLLISLPLISFIAWAGQNWVLQKLLLKFDKIQEYVFLLSIGWCLGIAQLAHSLGLSYEIGAFIAGVSIASSPIAFYIADALRPLRDFFLIMFFFGLGASFNIYAAGDILLPALLIALSLLILKPIVFRFLLTNHAETPKLSWETGVRLGQLSEFSLLIVFAAQNANLISNSTYYLVQLATIISFAISAYWIVMRYPTPMALNERLRRD